MNINSENKDALLGNLLAGGNSPPAKESGYNGSPLATSQMAVSRTLGASTGGLCVRTGVCRTFCYLPKE